MTSTIDPRVDRPASADSTEALGTSGSLPFSLEEVFDEYAPALTAFARSRGVQDPEDVVQDVFVAAVEQMPGFVGDRAGLRSLLFTIAYRRIIDRYRRIYRRPETLVAEHATKPAEEPTVEEIVVHSETASRAMEALAVLTDRERRVVEMRIFEESPPATVGQALGLSNGNVRVIQARALAKIRAHLTSTGEGGFAQPIVTLVTFPDFVRYLRSELPSDDILWPWIEELRSESPAPTLGVSVGATGAAVTQESMTATERVTETAYSLVSTVLSSGAARIGAMVSVVALTTVPAAPAVVAAVSEASVGRTVEVGETTALTSQGLGDIVQRSDDALAGDRIGLDAPISYPTVTVETERDSRKVLVGDGLPNTVSPAGDATEIEGATMNLVDDLVEPLLDDTVALLVDDVVAPLVTDVVEPLLDDTVALLVDDVVAPLVTDVAEPLFGEVVEPLVDDTMETLVDGVAQPLVNDAITPLVDSAVEPLPADLNNTLDEVGSGLSSLLDGL